MEPEYSSSLIKDNLAKGLDTRISMPRFHGKTYLSQQLKKFNRGIDPFTLLPMSDCEKMLSELPTPEDFRREMEKAMFYGNKAQSYLLPTKDIVLDRFKSDRLLLVA